MTKGSFHFTNGMTAFDWGRGKWRSYQNVPRNSEIATGLRPSLKNFTRTRWKLA
jgi:hypothetical protein